MGNQKKKIKLGEIDNNAVDIADDDAELIGGDVGESPAKR